MKCIVFLGCKSKKKMIARIGLGLKEVEEDDIIITSGYGGESEYMAHIINHYKPNNRIIIENQSKNTVQNMIYSFEWIEEIKKNYFNIEVIVIATSESHYTRSYILAKLINKLGRFNLKLKKSKKLIIDIALLKHICYNIITNKASLIKIILRRK